MDLGCGDGILASVIVEQFPDSTAVLADHSPPMLEAARNNFRESPASFRFCTVDYSVGEWVRSVEEFAPFDLIVSGFSIHHQPDARKRDLYAEIFDLLAPGGMFINLEHVSSATQRISDLWDRVRVDSLYQAAKESGSQKSRDEIAKEYLERPDRAANLFAPLELQCGWLRELGYTDVDCFFKFLELALFGGCRPA
jgi:SAM-dependent methyltransferase